jgi:hypothetical protein
MSRPSSHQLTVSWGWYLAELPAGKVASSTKTGSYRFVWAFRTPTMICRPRTPGYE